MLHLDFVYTPPEPLNLDLRQGIEKNDKKHLALIVGEPKVGHVRFAEQHLTAANGARATRLYQRALLSKMTRVPEDVMGLVPMSTFARASAFAQSFVEAGLEGRGEEPETADQKTSLTVTFDPPIEISGQRHESLTVTEPTLMQMSKADSILGDLSQQRIRLFQESIVTMCGDGDAILVTELPISVMNKLATFLMGFSAAGRAT